MAKFTTSILSGSYQLVMILFCSNIFSTKTPNSRSFLLILFKRRIYHPIIQRKAFKIISFDVQITKKNEEESEHETLKIQYLSLLLLHLYFHGIYQHLVSFQQQKPKKIRTYPPQLILIRKIIQYF